MIFVIASSKRRLPRRTLNWRTQMSNQFMTKSSPSSSSAATSTQSLNLIRLTILRKRLMPYSVSIRVSWKRQRITSRRRIRRASILLWTRPSGSLTACLRYFLNLEIISKILQVASLRREAMLLIATSCELWRPIWKGWAIHHWWTPRGGLLLQLLCWVAGIVSVRFGAAAGGGRFQKAFSLPQPNDSFPSLSFFFSSCFIHCFEFSF